MKEIHKLLFVLGIAVFFIGLFVLCDGYAQDITEEYASQITPSLIGQSSGSGDNNADVDVENMVEGMIRSDYSADVTISAMGDILVQSTQLDRAYDSDSGEFDFTESFVYLREILRSSDYAVATLKTTMAGSGNGTASEKHGYTCADSTYNSPEVLADNMKTAGLDLVNTANNHSLDSGFDGLVSTLEYLDDAGLAHVGTKAKESDDASAAVDIGGLDVAFIGYTNLTNDHTLDEDEAYALNTLDDYDTAKIRTLCQEVADAAEAHELVVVMLNFGSVDSDSVEKQQEALAQKLAQSGADVILGTGSTVLKPIRIISSAAANSGQCLVFYGMGAILSSMGYDYTYKDVDIAAVFNMNYTRNEMGEVSLKELTIIPMYLNWWDNKIQPMPVGEAMDTDYYEDELDDGDLERIEDSYANTVTNLLSGSGLSADYSAQDYAWHVNFIN